MANSLMQVEKFVCQRCLECCKRYWIALTPAEAKKQASFLQIPLKEFIQKFCVIYLQLFPSEFQEEKNVLFNSFLPKTVAAALQAKTGFLPQHLKVLPMLALQRNEKACIHLDEANKACKIYSARPKQCELFPFISLKDVKDFSKIYPFCVGLQKTGKFKEGWKEEQEKHFKENAEYFDSLREQEFEEFWPEIPIKGIVLFKDEELCEISRKEFEQILEAMNLKNAPTGI